MTANVSLTINIDHARSRRGNRSIAQSLHVGTNFQDVMPWIKPYSGGATRFVKHLQTRTRFNATKVGKIAFKGRIFDAAFKDARVHPLFVHKRIQSASLTCQHVHLFVRSLRIYSCVILNSYQVETNTSGKKDSSISTQSSLRVLRSKIICATTTT